MPDDWRTHCNGSLRDTLAESMVDTVRPAG